MRARRSLEDDSNRCGAHARSHVTPLPLLRAACFAAPAVRRGRISRGTTMASTAASAPGASTAQVRPRATPNAALTPALLSLSLTAPAARAGDAALPALPTVLVPVSWRLRQAGVDVDLDATTEGNDGRTAICTAAADARFSAGWKGAKTGSRDPGLSLSRCELRQPEAALAPHLLHSRCCSWS